MRKINYLLGVAAIAATFTACSSDDAVTSGGNNKFEKGNAYMSISLSMGLDTRAASDGGYDYGTEAESAINESKISFLFYDENGNYVTYGKILDGEKLSWEKETANPADNETKSSNAVVVLGPTSVKPAKVLAVLNYDDATSLQNKSLSTAIATVVSGTPSDLGSFVMTNSVEVANGEIQYATPITDDKIAETPDAARNNPVDIYVERTVAKAGMTATATNGKYVYPLSDKITIDGEEKQIAIEVVGWCVNAINEDGYLVKNAEDSWVTTSPIGIGWTGTNRTFWAKDKNYEDATGLKYYTYNEVELKESEYLYENTIDPTKAQASAGEDANVTTMLITAKIGLWDGKDLTKTGDLYRYKGAYYTPDKVKTLLMNELSNYYIETTTTETASDGTTTTKKAYAGLTEGTDGTVTMTLERTTDLSSITTTVALNNALGNNQKLVVKENGVYTETTEDALAAAVNKSSYVTGNDKIEGFKGGDCYYQVPIEQAGSTDAAPIYGVVRNHSYQLELSGISKIGGAVYNPDAEIIEIPGKLKDYYVAAKLHVLSWRVVKQTVNL